MGDAPPTCAANDQTTTTTLLAVLACSNVGATEEGYVYAWKWRSDDAPARLNDLLSASSHDVQLAVDGAYYWQPQYVSIAKRRVDTGETVAVYDVCPDPVSPRVSPSSEMPASVKLPCRAAPSLRTRHTTCTWNPISCSSLARDGVPPENVLALDVQMLVNS